MRSASRLLVGRISSYYTVRPANAYWQKMWVFYASSWRGTRRRDLPFSSSTSLVPCVSTTTGAGQEQTSSPELTLEKWTQVTELAADRPHAATHTDLVACCTRVVAERAEQHDFQAKAQERSEPRQQRR